LVRSIFAIAMLFWGDCKLSVASAVDSGQQDVLSHSNAPGAVFSFDIEAQALPAALDAYSMASRVSVLCDGVLARGRISATLRGVRTVREALVDLLKDTGLTAVFTDTRNAIIVLDPSTPPVAFGIAPTDTAVALGAIHVDAPSAALEPHTGAVRGSGGFYAYLVQSQLEHALRQNVRVAGHFQMRMRIWVDPAGVVQRSEVVSSTANLPLGESIRHTLENLPIGQPPPPDLLQPVTVRVAVWER
jgi:hypothetical protein